MDKEIVRLAIELTLLPGVGTQTQNRLWKAWDLRELFAAGGRTPGADTPPDGGVPKEARAAIRQRSFRARAEEIHAWAVREGVHVLVLGTPGYPALLGEIHDPPPVLYARGSLDALRTPPGGSGAPGAHAACVAVVGTRRPTFYGERQAGEFGAALGERGIVVVSGLARGVDAAAHRGCLAKGGTTVAVLGSGVDVVYPREHRRLAEDIAQKGLVLSEFPPGTPPAPHHFPVRNRVVSGMSLGTLVVEAGERSGSLITARLAMEQNREVFALPGNITTPQSLGPNYLIKQGAKLVQGWRDIVEELPEAVRRDILLKEDAPAHDAPDLRASSPEAAQVLELLREDEAVHFEQLLERLPPRAPGPPGAGASDVSRLGELLLELETSGRVRQLPGNLFVKLGK